MRSTIRALTMAAMLFTVSTTVRPPAAAAYDDFLQCTGVCISASAGCGLFVLEKADMCLVFLQGCFDGCNLL